MHKTFLAALLAAGLIAAPLQAFAQTTTTTQPATSAKAKKPQSPGQIAAHERMKKCAAEWKGAKTAGKIEKGMKWPQYWSACNKRLKAAG